MTRRFYYIDLYFHWQPSSYIVCVPVQAHSWQAASTEACIFPAVQITWLSRNTNKMQLCNRIYYSKVYWRINMFRAAYRSSSEALHCICSLWFIYPCGDRPLPTSSWQNFAQW